MSSSPRSLEIDFFIHSIPQSLVKLFEGELLQQVDVQYPINWQKQPLDHLSLKTKFRGLGEYNRVMVLISKLSKWGRVRWEAYCFGLTDHVRFRFAITPSLGIFRTDINDLGETILTESQINSAIARSMRKNIDLRDEINFNLGKPWDDELEIFRVFSKEEPVKYFKSYGN